MANEYATLYDLRIYLGLAASEINDDALLQAILERASREIDRRTGRRFYPRIETRYYDYPADDATRLILDEDLLAITTLTTDNGSTTISASDYYLFCGSRANLTPYDRIVLRDDGVQVSFSYSSSMLKSQAVTGEWGYHEQYADAWENSNDALTAAVNAGATTLSVGDADGADIWGNSPRFKAGQLLKIDNEIFYVVAVTAGTTNTLTVRPAFNGSTAAAHAKDAIIYIWRPMEDIVEATLRLAAYYYRRKDTADPSGTIGYPNLGMVVKPTPLPPDVAQTIERYRKVLL